MVRLLKATPPPPPRNRCLIFAVISLFPSVITLQCMLLYTLTSTENLIPTKNSHSQNGAAQQKHFVINPILRYLHLDSDSIYETLLMNHPHPTKNDYVLEVGCFSLAQSSFSSLMGFSTLSFDPSPKNFNRMENQFKSLPTIQQERMTLYNKAVSNVSGNKLLFSTAGGTGDHVEGVNLDQREHRESNKGKIDSVQVETVALDDALDEDVFGKNADANIFLIKIDVQGHEASVLEGLSRHLSKTRFVLLEYWVDALDQAKGVKMGTCTAVHDVLEVLHKANFELFDLSLQAHPQGEYDGGPKHAHVSDFYRPTDAYEHCQWFAKASQEGRDMHNYQMGFWTDILAVRRDEYSTSEIGNLRLQGRSPQKPGIRNKKDYQWTEQMQLRNVAGGMPLKT